MEEVMAQARARPRFLTQLLGLFGGLALVLAAVGTYGVMSYSVQQRMREMGIRIALGAEAGRVQSMVLKDGLGVAAIGLAIGLLGAWALSGVMESVLYGVATTDLVTFISVPLLLAGVAAAATWIPALRATRVDPVEVLKEE
jgi:ABC-type antimicrobial peptide transport system permease subunit